jgi:hypothetical protein
MRVAGSIWFVPIAARESASGVMMSTWLPSLLRASTWLARSVPHSGGVRRPSNWLRWCLAPPAQRREHHDVRMARGKVGVVGRAHATVDVTSAVDADSGDRTGQRGARSDRVHQLDAGFAVERSQFAGTTVPVCYLPGWRLRVSAAQA